MRVLDADGYDLLRAPFVMFLEGEGCMETASPGTFQEAVRGSKAMNPTI
jgi:hypothetical protein